MVFVWFLVWTSYLAAAADAADADASFLAQPIEQ